MIDDRWLMYRLLGNHDVDDDDWLNAVLIYWFIYLLIDLLNDWLIRLIRLDWLVDWLIDWLGFEDAEYV